jgi:hypothetical protein
MKRDLKINYCILEGMTQEIKRYKFALDTMERSASNMVRMLRQNTSMAISELEEMYTNFTVELKKIREELQDLYGILSSYTNEMQTIIRPVNKTAFTRVDRNDIYWNMQSILAACAGVWMLKTQQGYTGLSNISSIVKSDTEKRREEENYRKLERIWNEVIPRYARQLDVLSEALNNIHKKKIIPYENKDDDFNTKVRRLENKYTGFWEGIRKQFQQDMEDLGDLLKGFAVGIWDLIKGIVELLAGVVCYIAAAVVLDVFPPYAPTPECLKGMTEWAEKTFNGTNDTIVAILKDPMLVVEGLSQGISDAYEEEGLAYCTGYAIGSVVGVKGIDKLAKVAKLGMAGEAAAGTASKLDEFGITAAECSKMGLTADTFAEFVAKYGDDAAKALKNGISPDMIKKLEQLGVKPVDYTGIGLASGESAEAIAGIAAKYGDDAVNAIKSGISPGMIEKLEQLGIKPGEYAGIGIAGGESAEAIAGIAAKYGDDAVNAIKNGISPGMIEKLEQLGIKPGEYAGIGIASGESAEAIAGIVTKYGDDAVNAIKNGISPEMIKKLEQLGIKPSEYEKLGITNGETAEKSIEVAAKPKIVFNTKNEYFDYINDIGKSKDLSVQEKLEKIKEAYNSLGDKTDINCPIDSKYVTGFDDAGRVIYDWPDKMGFKHDTIAPITRENPLPSKWDRYGTLGGDNFASIPENGVKYTYDQRSIPYVENPYAYHSGTFNNDIYFDVIDAIKNEDSTMLNDILKNNSCNTLSKIEFKDICSSYKDFINKAKIQVGDIDATYGLSGNAAPWINNGKTAMQGGAGQIITPFNGDALRKLGILVELK